MLFMLLFFSLVLVRKTKEMAAKRFFVVLFVVFAGKTGGMAAYKDGLGSLDCKI